MKPEHFRLCVYSLGHFWIDFCCALLMFSRLFGGGEWVVCVLLYNFCAFALQMPIGLLADRWGWNGRVAAVGCALVLAGWLLVPIPIVAAVTAGVGNACFHVGGGIQILTDGGKRSAPLGIFVSPGAFGIYFGTLLGKQNAVPLWGIALGMLLFVPAFLFLDHCLKGTSPSDALELSLSGNALWVLVCCFLVVVLRSYLGLVLSFPCKTGPWVFWTVCAVVLGKAAGGFLGDRLGMVRAAAVSLGLSAVLFCFSSIPLAGTVAVFLFNMTMPITLWAAAQLLPGGKGFAFGMLTFALFLGFLPVWLGWPALLQSGLGYAIGAVCSLVLLVLGLKRGRL